jgi:hypothetical protein
MRFRWPAGRFYLRGMAETNANMEKWLPDAEKIEVSGNPLGIPYDVFLKEASQLADFMQRYWEKSTTRPGLKGIASRLPSVEDLRSKIRAVQEAQTELLLVVDPKVLDKGERARFLIEELESVSDFVLDDDVHEDADDRLAQIREFHSQDGQRSSALSQSLRDYAALARSLGERIPEADADFDLTLIAEAEALSEELASAPPVPISSGSKAATKRRNQFIALVLADVSRGRKAARHAFRRFPELASELGSAYERRRRAANRRARLDNEAKADAAKKADPK